MREAKHISSARPGGLREEESDELSYGHLLDGREGEGVDLVFGIPYSNEITLLIAQKREKDKWAG